MTSTIEDASAPASTPATQPRRPKRKLRKLEKRLTTVRAVEAKRTRQAEKARARDGADKLVAKRVGQLEKASRRSAALEALIAELRDTVPVAPAKAKANGSSASIGRPTASRKTTAKGAPPTVLRAFCLRERKTVEMQDAAPMVMKNGRKATVGNCPNCGARLIRPG